MLQVKYAAKCQTHQPLSVCGRYAHLPITIYGSSSRLRAPGRVVAVDPGEAAPVIAELNRSGASLAAILLTHHHPDHIGGVPGLLRLAQVPVIGPDDDRIPGRTRTVRDGERCELPDLGLTFDILHVPGHTLSHIAFWGHGALFCGDTLFSAGCGRMFEGTPTQMNASLNRLSGLPPETDIFCGHEYTAANLRFALTVDPANRGCARVSGPRRAPARRRHPDAAIADVAGNSRQSVFALRRRRGACKRRGARAAALCAIRPRSLPYCAPGRTGSVSGTHGAAR